MSVAPLARVMSNANKSNDLPEPRLASLGELTPWKCSANEPSPQTAEAMLSNTRYMTSSGVNLIFTLNKLQQKVSSSQLLE